MIRPIIIHIVGDGCCLNESFESSVLVLMSQLLISVCRGSLFTTFQQIYPNNLNGLPWWLRWQRICLRCRRPGFDPWVGKIPWRRAWQPIPVFLPGDSPWTEEPGGLQSMRLQRVRHNWATKYRRVCVSLVTQLCPTLCDPMDLQSASLLCPWGFSRQEHWNGLPCPPLGYIL